MIVLKFNVFSSGDEKNCTMTILNFFSTISGIKFEYTGISEQQNNQKGFCSSEKSSFLPKRNGKIFSENREKTEKSYCAFSTFPL